VGVSRPAAPERGHATSDRLSLSYAYCRALHRAHGRTYYLATRLLPAWKRPHVHALYGFTRYTDEIVDRTELGGQDIRQARLRAWTHRVRAALDGEPVLDPVLPALVNTVTVFRLDRADFDAFLRSMEMDLTVAEYPTYEDLLEYMAGSAAAIGSMMLPILGVHDVARLEDAGTPARQLGLAFQLTNFIRDVAEDLDRGRVYLPLADLARFGLSPRDLRERRATEPVRRLVAFEVARAHHHYALAAPGIPMLEPTSQACMRTAFRLYGGILDEVARAGFDVFARRAVVPLRRRLAVAAACLMTPAGTPVPVPAGWAGQAATGPRLLAGSGVGPGPA
jgi:phytoene synthase